VKDIQKKIRLNYSLDTTKKRTKGQNFPPYYIKLAIMIFITGNHEKTTYEIKSHLKKIFNIREARGVRRHLSELCKTGYLDKESTRGMDNRYFWKKTNHESFQNTVNLFSKNSEAVQDILKIYYKMKKDKRDFERRREQKLIKSYIQYDVARIWYSTKYTESFLTKKSLVYFMSKAYKICKTDKAYTEYLGNKIRNTKAVFETIILEGHSHETILTMMKHSPNLVYFIANLDQEYKKMTVNMNKRKDLIFQMVLEDMFVGSYISHGGNGIPFCTVNEIRSNGKVLGIKMEMQSTLNMKGGGWKNAEEEFFKK